MHLLSRLVVKEQIRLRPAQMLIDYKKAPYDLIKMIDVLDAMYDVLHPPCTRLSIKVFPALVMSFLPLLTSVQGRV